MSNPNRDILDQRHGHQKHTVTYKIYHNLVYFKNLWRTKKVQPTVSDCGLRSCMYEDNVKKKKAKLIIWTVCDIINNKTNNFLYFIITSHIDLSMNLGRSC